MARPVAQLEQDVADAERLATLHVTQTVARRLLEEVRERDALLADARYAVASGRTMNPSLLQRIDAVLGER